LIRSPRSSPERRLVPAALLLAGLALSGGPAAAQAPTAAPPGEVPAKVRAVLADPRFQRDLPPDRELDGAHLPTKREPGTEEVPPVAPERDEDADAKPFLPSLGIGALLGKVIFTVLLVVIGGLIVSWIAREVMARRERSAAPLPTPAAVAEGEGPEPNPTSFDDASRLAAEGHYAEAVHALLLAAIRHFAARAKTPVQASRTSRELVRLLPLAPDAREAFAELVGTVERSLFGGGEVGAEDYERSRARFQALTGRAA
jgi:hypothetical protein